MKKILIEVVGWYGAVGLVLAYSLSSFSVITPDSLLYQLLNLTAGLGIIIVSVHKRNYQPAAVNVIWVAIALISIINILK